jgi:hypothetical protein
MGFILIVSAARIPLPLHLPMAQDPPSVSSRQPRLGVPEVRKMTMEETDTNLTWIFTNLLE